MNEPKASLVPDWKNADPSELEPHFSSWMLELTAQGLHDKGDIATVLAMQSAELADLKQVDDVTMTAFAKLEGMFKAQVLRAEVAEAQVVKLQADLESWKERAHESALAVESWEIRAVELQKNLPAKNKPVVCYSQCAMHKHVPWEMTVTVMTGYVATVCPICHPPEQGA